MNKDDVNFNITRFFSRKNLFEAGKTNIRNGNRAILKR